MSSQTRAAKCSKCDGRGWYVGIVPPGKEVKTPCSCQSVINTASGRMKTRTEFAETYEPTHDLEALVIEGTYEEAIGCVQAAVEAGWDASTLRSDEKWEKIERDFYLRDQARDEEVRQLQNTIKGWEMEFAAKDEEVKRAQLAERKCEKLKQLMLLTDPAISGVVLNGLALVQWSEFIKEFPDEASVPMHASERKDET